MRTRRTTEQVREAVRMVETSRETTGDSLTTLLKRYKVNAAQYYKFRDNAETRSDREVTVTTFNDKDIIALVRSNLTAQTKTKILSTLF